MNYVFLYICDQRKNMNLDLLYFEAKLFKK